VADILACLDEVTRRKLINSMPEIKSRRVAARIPKQPTQRGMAMKGRLIMEVNARAKDKAKSDTEVEGEVRLDKVS
jgi:hypothetical protein